MLQYAIPVTVAGLALVSFERNRRNEQRRAAAMTPKRKAVYEAALLSLKDPSELRKLADAFEDAGLDEEASTLRKRAKIRELPADIQAARREAFRTFMNCKDPKKVIEGADAFSSEACYSAANNLRLYASGLVADDVNVINRIILELESGCTKIPESGEVRSIAVRSAVNNLKSRVNTMQDESPAKDAGELHANPA